MRKLAGFSQEDIAHELHIARSSISKLETNQLDLKAFDLFRWAKTTENQDLVAAMLLGIDVAILQQALDIASTMVAGGITWNVTKSIALFIA